ncbi:MAG: sulfotransferase family 2 domain-containing protein [Alphaproteobacteria bacterium]|nr:sulfotransferase family 2 domain-containing protein [Alphaproteobacteria bacterium]
MERFVAYVNERPEETPLFFYHLPKTGGTTVDGVLTALAAVRRRSFQLLPRKIGMREAAFPDHLRKSESALVFAGHCLFGMHTELGVRVNLCTVLRHPVERVVSEYLWTCRFYGRAAKVSETDFSDYLDNIAVPNLMTRLLIGSHEIAWGATARAMEHLASFYLVGSTARLDAFLGALLSSYGGPNVRMTRAKEERNPAKAALAARFAETIAARNRHDVALYAHGERHLFGRADEMLAAFTTPNPDDVVVRTVGAKSFELGRLKPRTAAAPARSSG